MGAGCPEARPPGPPARWLRAGLLAFFEQLYGPWAALYEPVSWLVSRGAWARWVRSALPEIDRGPVLEIGPGTGHLLAALARTGAGAGPVVGLDRSGALLARARRRLGPAAGRGDGMGVGLVRAEARAL